jgi:hypothetical protein
MRGSPGSGIGTDIEVGKLGGTAMQLMVSLATPWLLLYEGRM